MDPATSLTAQRLLSSEVRSGPSRLLVPLSSAVLGLFAAQASAFLIETNPPDPHPRASVPATAAERPAPADTSQIYRLAEILITAPSPGMIAEPGRTEVPGPAIEARDGGSAEVLAPLVPSARAVTNSRGETIFALRGASERQIAIYHDGVALNIPWDERVDLSLVPIEAVGTVHVVRGSGSVLEGPNTLAGIVHLLSRTLETDGRRSLLTLQAGEGGGRRANLVHLYQRDEWSFLGSVSHEGRSTFLLPTDFGADRNQSDSRGRLNSDRQESSLLVRLGRAFPGRGAIAFSAGGTTARKGVPPEIHRAERARFWRIPLWRRALFSVQGDLHPDAQDRYRITGVLALDLMRQEIQQYPDSTYAAPQEILDEERESDRDVTGSGRLRLSRRLGTESHLSAAFSIRASEHRESLERDGPVATYSQVLGSTAVEWEGSILRFLAFRAGMGMDFSRTPRTGNAPEWGPATEPVVGLRLSWELSERLGFHLKGGRRTRFPSLRELYSGALGKFVPNPSLRSETLDSFELGGGIRGRRAEIAVDGFVHLMSDGIVKVALPDGKQQRRNEEEIRSLGVELSGGWRPLEGIRFDAHHTFLHARARENGSFTAIVDDRADYLSYVSAHATRPIGRSPAGLAKVGIEGVFRGPRWSLDANVVDSVRLPAAAVWNIRIAWSLPRTTRRAVAGEVYLRVNNILDQTDYAKVGLPEAGRHLLGGLRLEF